MKASGDQPQDNGDKGNPTHKRDHRLRKLKLFLQKPIITVTHFFTMFNINPN